MERTRTERLNLKKVVLTCACCLFSALCKQALAGDELTSIYVQFDNWDAVLDADNSWASSQRARLGNSEVRRQKIKIVSPHYDVEISRGAQSKLKLLNNEDRVIHVLEDEALLPDVLLGYSRQREILQLQGSGSSLFSDNETLELKLVAANSESQTDCTDEKQWAATDIPNHLQVLPICFRFHIEITLSEKSPESVSLGVFFLVADGTVSGLPREDEAILLQPGETYRFPNLFQAGTPLDVLQYLVAFGVQGNKPLDWKKLKELTSSLQLSKNQFVAQFQKLISGSSSSSGNIDSQNRLTDDVWTKSALPMSVSTNINAFQKTDDQDSEFSIREYTIAQFDIRPYLPDDTQSALYRVLQQAEYLTHYGGIDGVNYKQHAWDKDSDADNLKVGIDCSRAIWFAFDRAGLPYNRQNRYLATYDMVQPDNLMNDEFERCDLSERELGDVLVYRDDERGDGHVVMVIDPLKRIAWGSHGWDGNTKYDIDEDLGVEYQKIKIKKDWAAWDRSTMRLSACWRYRKFHQQRLTRRGVPGLQALADSCVEGMCEISW